MSQVDAGPVLDKIADLALRMRARRVIDALARLPRGSRVLDCGAGNVFYGHAIRRLGLPLVYVAADPDEVALRWGAEAGASPGSLIAADGMHLPFHPQSFDCALLSEVLEHVPEPASLLREVARLLRPDALVIATVPSARYPFFWDPVNRTRETLIGRPVREGFWAGIWAGHHHLYTPELLRRHFTDAGYAVQRIDPVTGWCLPFHHNVVHLGARLLYGGHLPSSFARSVDRFTADDTRPIWPARAAFATTRALERLNDRRRRRKVSVGLYAEARFGASDEIPPRLPADIRVIAMAAEGAGLSGSDRIFIEMCRRWARWGHRVTINLWEEGLAMTRRSHLPDGLSEVWPAAHLAGRGRMRSHLGRTRLGLREIRRAPIPRGALVYSASDFWPDVFPAILAKFRKGARWIAAFYMFAPPPHRGFEGRFRRGLPRLEDVLYWLSQRAVLPLIRRWAEVILVTSDDERARLRRLGVEAHRIVVVRGGVDIDLTDRTPPAAGPGYDAVFVGRLHVQKGVRQLLEIWTRVLREIPDARLGIIGVGPLQRELAERAARPDLKGRVDLLGFMDGAEKIAVLKTGKVVVHPALFDSGGMAACEAFSCGLPGVSFDLHSLRTYYPQGMLKVPPYDLDAFAGSVVRLLRDDTLRESMGKEARALAEGWDWELRVREVSEEIARGLSAGQRA